LLILQAYEQEVREREGVALAEGLEEMFQRLKDNTDDDDSIPKPPLVRLPSADLKRPPVELPSKTRRKNQKIQDKAPAKEPPAKKQKVTAKKQTLKKKPKQNKTPAKMLRENVSQAHFVLSGLKWSQWKPAMRANAPAGDGIKWIPRRGGQIGVRNATLFGDDKRSQMALYEFAIQTAPKRKLHVVYFTCTQGFRKRYIRWDRHLFRRGSIPTLITKILQQDDDIVLLARRAFIPKAGIMVDGRQLYRSHSWEFLGHLQRRYDYAWKRCRSGRSRRDLYKNGFAISMSGI
jgi:hypothetical protein